MSSNLFERVIASEALAKPTPPAVEPATDQSSGELVIKGGAIKWKERPHKDWRHVIQANHELRNRVHTLLYRDVADIGASVALDLSHSYNLIRGPAVPLEGALNLTVDLPGGVPEDQGILLDGRIQTRKRVHVIDLQIFYPQETQLTFSDQFVFGRSTTKGEPWLLEDFSLLLGGSENPVVAGLTLTLGAETLMPDLVRRTVDVTLDQELSETPRPAGTTDYFRVSYNEQTGKALITALALGVVGDQDPAIDPEAPTTEPDTDPTTPPEKETPPTDSRATPGPKLPRPDTELEYTDENGNPLEPEPMPEGRGIVFALHSNGFSWSENGGRTWDLRLLSVASELVDIAATATGIYVLDADGRVWHMPTARGEITEVKPSAVVTASERELAVVNGDFELGSLDGWTHVSGDVPRVLDSSSPAQREGSTHYLTRDWRLINPQDFVIQQILDVPEDVAGTTGVVKLYADAFTDNGDIARIELIDGTEIVLANSGLTFTFSGGVYTCANFASARNGNLRLVGQTVPGVGNFVSPASGFSVQLQGASSPSGTINWRVEYIGGALFEGLVAIRVTDLDGANGPRETLTIQGVIDYDLTGSEVTAFDEGPERVLFRSPAGDTNPGAARGSLSVVVKPTFSMLYTVGTQGAITIGRPLTAPGEDILASAEHSQGEWKTIVAEHTGRVPSKLIVRVSGEAVGGYADVFIDNIKLGIPIAPDALRVGAMAPVRQRHQGGGVDLYVNNTVIALRRDQSVDDNLAPRESFDGSSDVVNGAATVRAAFGSAPWERVVLAGDDVYSQATGAWTSSLNALAGVPGIGAIAEPFAAVATSAGNVVLFNETGPFGATISTGVTATDLVPDFLRAGAVVTGGAGDIRFVDGSTAATWARQPANATAANRRTLAMDSGRYIGHNAGGYDLFYTLQPNIVNTWKVAGRLERPIVKMVEMR